MDTTAAAELGVGASGAGVDGVAFWEAPYADQDPWPEEEFEPPHPPHRPGSSSGANGNWGRAGNSGGGGGGRSLSGGRPPGSGSETPHPPPPRHKRMRSGDGQPDFPAAGNARQSGDGFGGNGRQNSDGFGGGGNGRQNSEGFGGPGGNGRPNSEGFGGGGGNGRQNSDGFGGNGRQSSDGFGGGGGNGRQNSDGFGGNGRQNSDGFGGGGNGRQNSDGFGGGGNGRQNSDGFGGGGNGRQNSEGFGGGGGNGRQNSEGFGGGGGNGRQNSGDGFGGGGGGNGRPNSGDGFGGGGGGNGRQNSDGYGSSPPAFGGFQALQSNFNDFSSNPGGQGPTTSASSGGGGGQGSGSAHMGKGGKGTGSIFFKTKLCSKFRLGICPYNSNCNFAHGTEELRKPPPGWEEIAAAQEAERAMRSNRDVQGQSNLSTQSTADSQRPPKTRLCKKYYSEEGCPYGDRCIFLHDDERAARESNAISLGPTLNSGSVGGGGSDGNRNNNGDKPPNWKTKICNKWEMTGHCPFGQKCHFAHGYLADGHVSVANSRHAGGMVVVASVPMQRISMSESSSQWKGPADEISTIYGDWVEDDDLEYLVSMERPPSNHRQMIAPKEEEEEDGHHPHHHHYHHQHA